MQNVETMDTWDSDSTYYDSRFCDNDFQCSYDHNVIDEMDDNTLNWDIFASQVEWLLHSPAKDRERVRNDIIGKIQASRNPLSRVITLLNVAKKSGADGALGCAIDVLSQTTHSTELMLHTMLMVEGAGEQYRIHDDDWYVILRAYARCSAPWECRRFVVSQKAHSIDASVRESVIEALGDLEDFDTLRYISKNDSDAFLRKLAGEILSDLEG